MKKLIILLLSVLITAFAFAQTVTIAHPYYIGHFSTFDYVSDDNSAYIPFTHASSLPSVQGDSIIAYNSSTSTYPANSLVTIPRDTSISLITVNCDSVSYTSTGRGLMPIVTLVKWDSIAYPNVEFSNISVTEFEYDSLETFLTSATYVISSIEEFNALTLAEFDTVGIQASSEIKGTINIDVDNVMVAAYGTGYKPTLIGKTSITGWTQHSGNIYKTTVDSSFNSLFDDDVKMILAKTDGTDDQSLMYPVTTVVNDSIFTCDSIIGTDWTGAYIGGKWDPWDFRSHTVIACNSTTGEITLDRATSPSIQATYDDFFIANHISLLDEAGEWCYDDTDNTLYFWATDGLIPSNVEVSTTENAIYAYGVSNVSIKNLNIEGFDDTGIKLRGLCNNVTIDNCDFTDNYLAAVGGCNAFPTFTHMSTNLTVSNCNIDGSFGDGIWIHGDDSHILNNNISNIGLFSNLGLSDLRNDAANAGLKGVSLYSADDAIVVNNIVENTGYSGIQFGGANTNVSFNVVKRACLSLQDGGGIYTYDHAGGVVIENNIVAESGGGLDYSYETHGIYLDATSSMITVRSNTVSGCTSDNSFGLFVSHASYCNIYGNVSYNNSQQFKILGNRADIYLNYDTIQNNTFYSLYSTQTAANYDIGDTALVTYTLGNNGYYNAQSLFPISNGTDYSLLEWQTKTAQEVNSLTFDSTLLYYENAVYLAAAIVDKDFTASFTATVWYDWKDTTLLDDGCLRAWGPYNTGGVYTLDTTYLIEFDAISDGVTTGELYLDSRLIGEYAATTTRQHFTFLASRTEGDSYASLSLSTGTGQDYIYIDNIKMTPVSVEELDPLEVSKLFVNDTSETVDIENPTLYLQPDGSAMPTTLGAFESVIGIKQ